MLHSWFNLIIVKSLIINFGLDNNFIPQILWKGDTSVKVKQLMRSLLIFHIVYFKFQPKLKFGLSFFLVATGHPGDTCTVSSKRQSHHSQLVTGALEVTLERRRLSRACIAKLTREVHRNRMSKVTLSLLSSILSPWPTMSVAAYFKFCKSLRGCGWDVAEQPESFFIWSWPTMSVPESEAPSNSYFAARLSGSSNYSERYRSLGDCIWILESYFIRFVAQGLPTALMSHSPNMFNI